MIAELELLSLFSAGNNPTLLKLVNEAAMIVNSIKRLFILMLFRKNEHFSPDDYYF